MISHIMVDRWQLEQGLGKLDYIIQKREEHYEDS